MADKSIIGRGHTSCVFSFLSVLRMRSIWINMSSKRCACWSRWRLVVETGGLDVVALGVVREMEALFNPHWNRPLLLSSSSRSMKSNKKKRGKRRSRNSRRVGFPFITSSFPGWSSSSRAISSLGSIWRQHNNSSSWLGDISIPSLNSLLPLATVFFLFFYPSKIFPHLSPPFIHTQYGFFSSFFLKKPDAMDGGVWWLSGRRMSSLDSLDGQPAARLATQSIIKYAVN